MNQRERTKMFLMTIVPPPPSPCSGDNIQTVTEGSSVSNPIHIEAELEKDIPNTASGKSPISKSLDDIINVVINSH